MGELRIFFRKLSRLSFEENLDFIAKNIEVGKCIWISRLSEGKESGEALKIADSVLPIFKSK